MLKGLVQSRNTREGKISTKSTPVKKMAMGTHISPTKSHRLAEWKQHTHFRAMDTYRLKAKAQKKIFHVNGKQKKAGIAILISDKIDLKIKTVTRDKGHYIMIKRSIQEENTSVINTSVLNAGPPP